MIESIAIAAVALAIIGLIAYLVRRGDSAVDKQSDSRAAQVDMEAHLEREKYEHELTKRSLESARRTISILEAVADDYVNADPNPDLDARDVRGRVLREAADWAARDRALRPEPADDVPPVDEPGPGSDAADLRHPEGPDV